MPRYDYQCFSCGHKFELRQSFDSAPETDCPECAGLSKRKFYAVPVIYKGSGFYTTDYKNNGNSSDSKQEKDEGSEESSKEKSKASNTESTKSEGSKADAPKKEKETAAKEKETAAKEA